MPTNVFAIIVAIFTIVIIGELVRRRKMLEKYAILWITVGIGTLLLTIFPGILDFFSGLIGIKVSSNLFFALYVFLILGVCLHLSWELSATEDKVRTLAEELALLRETVEHNDTLNNGTTKPSATFRNDGNNNHRP